jgi:hypothetical protein
MTATAAEPLYVAERLAALHLANLVRRKIGLPAVHELSAARSDWASADRSYSCPIAATICEGEDLLYASVGSSGIVVRDTDIGSGWGETELYHSWGEEITPDAVRFMELADEGYMADLYPARGY